MLYSLRSMRYLKVVNFEVYEEILAYYERVRHKTADCKQRVMEARQAEVLEGGMLLYPLEWYVSRRTDPKYNNFVGWCG